MTVTAADWPMNLKFHLDEKLPEGSFGDLVRCHHDPAQDTSAFWFKMKDEGLVDLIQHFTGKIVYRRAEDVGEYPTFGLSA